MPCLCERKNVELAIDHQLPRVLDLIVDGAHVECGIEQTQIGLHGMTRDAGTNENTA